jgi:hypothetical protein
MARVETETITKVCLHMKQIDKMHAAIHKAGDEFWVRLIVTTDACEVVDTTLEALLQGPDGEEEQLFHIED